MSTETSKLEAQQPSYQALGTPSAGAGASAAEEEQTEKKKKEKKKDKEKKKNKDKEKEKEPATTTSSGDETHTESSSLVSMAELGSSVELQRSRLGPSFASSSSASSSSSSSSASASASSSLGSAAAGAAQPQPAEKAGKYKYDMKNHMANERTFFKYLFTGLHIGGLGTFVLTFFAENDVYKLYVVIGIWAIAFGFMFWGLYNYYHRKYLMEIGKFKDKEHLLNPHTPAIITILFAVVIALVLLYALFTAGSMDGWHPLNNLYALPDPASLRSISN